MNQTTFTGVAPGAKLLPLRYTESNGSSSDGGGDPGALAGAIDTAVDRGAGVILVAVPAGSDSPALGAALEHAKSRGAVVISAAAATQQGAHTYPTASKGVLAVGSTDESGAPVQSEAGDYLGIAAPGANLVSTSAGGGGAVAHRWPITDPSLAAAYVAERGGARAFGASGTERRGSGEPVDAHRFPPAVRSARSAPRLGNARCVRCGVFDVAR